MQEGAWFPPVVRIKGRGRYAFLLGWRLDKHGKWHGHVAWLVREQVLWRGVDVWMRAETSNRSKTRTTAEFPAGTTMTFPSDRAPQPADTRRPAGSRRLSPQVRPTDVQHGSTATPPNSACRHLIASRVGAGRYGADHACAGSSHRGGQAWRLMFKTIAGVDARRLGWGRSLPRGFLCSGRGRPCAPGPLAAGYRAVSPRE